MSLRFVCPHCGVYSREERFDGRNHYAACAHCGRSELQVVWDPDGPGDEPPFLHTLLGLLPERGHDVADVSAERSTT